MLRDLSSLRRELTSDEINRFRLACVLTDWMEGLSALEIENKYRLYLGQMDNLARQTAWLLSSAAAVIGAADRYSRLPSHLENLAFSAGTGLPVALRDFHADLGEILFRGEFLRLQADGIVDTAGLIAAGDGVWRDLVSSPERLSRIEKILTRIKESKMRTSVNHSGRPVVFPQSIEIDGTPVRERYVVRIDGQPIKLTGKSFKYLVSLVWSRVTRDGGWLYKEDLEQGFNQSRYLYRLRQEIGRDFLPDWPLYENNRSGYYTV